MSDGDLLFRAPEDERAYRCDHFNTPRGIKLGDKEEDVIRLYGQPDNSKIIKGGDKILTYKAQSERKDVAVKNLVLYFTISNGSVTSFHLVSNMPGAKKPF